MVIKGIIFDFGGVVVNDNGKPTFKDMSKLLGRSYESVKVAVENALPRYQTGKINKAEFCNLIASELKIDAPISKWGKIWGTSYIKHVRVDKEIIFLVKKLKKAGYKLAVLSNTEPPHAKFNRKNKRFKDFSTVILSCEVGLRKPDKKIYELTLTKLNLKASECIFIDDEPRYIAAASKLGINSILYQNSNQLKEELKEFGLI